MLTRSLCIAMVCAVSSVLPAWAHHSHNNYDTAVWTTMEGTVTEVHRLVPHSWIYMEVKDAKGEAATWALEGTGPGGLEKVGIKVNDVRPGDRIKVRCHCSETVRPGVCWDSSRRYTATSHAATAWKRIGTVGVVRGSPQTVPTSRRPSEART